MNKNSKILLATDYSNAVMNAERYAVQYANSTKSILSLVHVYQVPLSTPDKPLEYSRNIIEQREYELKRLEKHRDELFRSLNINVNEVSSECIIREGSAANQICKEAQESGADLILIGTHGESGFRETIFGSHTWNVIKRSSVPVLVIPQNALFSGIKNIVFGTEYRAGELPVINFLARFAKQFNAGITLLHVTNYNLSKELEKEIFEKFRAEVKGKVLYEKLKVRLIKNDDLVAGLNTYCINEKTDLLVMSPEKKNLFEKIFVPAASMTHKMSFHSSIPLLAIPDFYNPEYAGFWKFFSKADYVDEEF